MLRQEIACLRTQLVTLRGALDSEVKKITGDIDELFDKACKLAKLYRTESDDTTDHFKSVHQYLADIHDYLMPVFHKVFPRYAADKKAIDEFMRTYGASDKKRKRG